jgi:DNA-directed RNA polymerase subunit omega
MAERFVRWIWMAVEREFDSNYRYVLVAARRARQLQNGSQPLVNSRTSKPNKLAQEEIKAGMVGYVRGPLRDKIEIESTVVPRFASQ